MKHLTFGKIFCEMLTGRVPKTYTVRVYRLVEHPHPLEQLERKSNLHPAKLNYLFSI